MGGIETEPSERLDAGLATAAELEPPLPELPDILGGIISGGGGGGGTLGLTSDETAVGLPKGRKGFSTRSFTESFSASAASNSTPRRSNFERTFRFPLDLLRRVTSNPSKSRRGFLLKE